MRHRGAAEGLLLSKKGIERVLVPWGRKPKVATITYSKPLYQALVDKADKSRIPKKPQPAPEIPRAQAEALIRTKSRGHTYIAIVKTDGIGMHRKTIATGFCEGNPISAIPDTGKKNFVNLVHSHLFNLGHPKPYPRDLDDLCSHVWDLNWAAAKAKGRDVALTAQEVLEGHVSEGFRVHSESDGDLNTLTVLDLGFSVATEKGEVQKGWLRMEPEEFVKLQNYLMKGVPPGSHKTWVDLFGVDNSGENPITRWAKGLRFEFSPFKVEPLAPDDKPRPEDAKWVKGKWQWPFSPLTDEEKVRLDEMIKPEHAEASGAPYKTPEYYDNSKGSLYKVASERGWNPYLFDIVKRLERGGKKDPLETEINKTIALLELWKNETLENKR